MMAEVDASKVVQVLLLVGTGVLLQSSCSYSANGLVTLDGLSFDKVLRVQPYLLVKFHKSHRAGPDMAVYRDFSQLAVRQEQLLVATMPMGAYSIDEDNGAITKKFGVTVDDFPHIRLFAYGQISTSHAFASPITTEALVKFVRQHASLYIGYPGCLEAFDEIAYRAASSAAGNANTHEEKARDMFANLTDAEEIASANIYIQILEKIGKRGHRYPSNEVHRVRRLMETKLSQEKKRELQLRLNILKSFTLDEGVLPAGHDEL